MIVSDLLSKSLRIVGSFLLRPTVVVLSLQDEDHSQEDDGYDLLGNDTVLRDIEPNHGGQSNLRWHDGCPARLSISTLQVFNDARRRSGIDK